MDSIRTFKYELDAEKVGENYVIFGKYVVTPKGQIHGRNIRASDRSKKLVFNHGRRMYYVGKVILQLFGTGVATKEFCHIDGNVKNCSIKNLVWGTGADERHYPPSLPYKGSTYYKVPSFKGYYINAEAEVISYRDRRKGIVVMTQRSFEGHPSVSFNTRGIKYRTAYVHLMMLEVFKSLPYGTTKCIWKDENRGNCKIKNLLPADESEIRIRHFEVGRRDPNMLRNILDKKYGKNKRPWGGKRV